VIFDKVIQTNISWCTVRDVRYKNIAVLKVTVLYTVGLQNTALYRPASTDFQWAFIMGQFI